ncbi:MAG: hypothetical protein JXA09_01920 [Anaerolineae bacterium]|nr:hypothetical protein [Anaerolineae bacterium]
MAWIDSLTERTTAATDVALGLVAMIAAVYVYRLGVGGDAWKAGLWSWAFGLLAFASLLGAAAHGLQMSDRLRDLLWQPLNVALGLTIALFAVGVVRDAWGTASARRVLPFLVAIGFGFYGLTRLVPGTFLVFVLFEAAAMLFALVVYVVLAVRGDAPGAVWMAAGIAIALAAAAIQASGAVTVRLIWPFDHNGVFHMVQVVGCVVLLVGLRAALLAAPHAT